MSQAEHLPASGELPADVSAALDDEQILGLLGLGGLAGDYQRIRQQTENLCAPLATEDYVLQSMPEASPAKWHLAHTTWFYETFILTQALPGYRVFDKDYAYLFNSYYNSAGPMHARPRRGMLSRPTVEEVYAYRHYVDAAMHILLADPERLAPRFRERLLLGLNHEQQHQELILTDIKHAFSCNPLRPACYPAGEDEAGGGAGDMDWVFFEGGLVTIGHAGEAFCFDNERPAHRVWLEPYYLASRPVTNGEYLEFMEAGGYRRHELWLSDAWATVQAQGWEAPLYWYREGGDWWHYTLAGPRPVDHEAPVCHVSHYEADAYARWRGMRLPTEAEWEHATAGLPVTGHFQDSGHYQPRAAPAGRGLRQMYGGVWEWTASAYLGYPGYRALFTGIAEYNGKFMSGQFVLRGGSCATPAGHVRPSYRNFFYPPDRWQFSGIRLAADKKV